MTGSAPDRDICDLRSLPVVHQGSPVPTALWLRCSVRGNCGATRVVPALVDTGAGLNFCVTPTGASPFDAIERGSCSIPIRLADGSVRKVAEWVRLAVSVHLGDGSLTPAVAHCFYVLDGPGLAPLRGDPVLIAGRRMLTDLKISVLSDPLRVLLGGRDVLYHDRANDVSLVEESRLALTADPQALDATEPPANGHRVLEPSEADSVHIPFNDVPVICQRLLDDLVARSWQPMRNCPGWEARLRPLLSEELSDNAAQTHVFELRCNTVRGGNLPVVSPTSRRISLQAYERLNEVERAAFDKLVAGYEQRQWWVECDDRKLRILAGREYVLDPSIVFMVPAAPRRKARLVVDLRKANQRLRKGSSPSIDVSTCIAAARLHSSSCLLLLDACQAFYKLRWLNMKALLLVRGQLYLSDRCVFGISTGPGSLSHTLGAVAEAFRRVCSNDYHLFLNDFADDLLCAGEDAAKAVCWLIYTMTRCGFTVGISKFQPMATARMKLLVMSVLHKLGLPEDLFVWQDSVNLLGCTLSYDYSDEEGSLVVACERHERLRSARTQARQLLVALDNMEVQDKGITKSFIFSCGGNLAYDSCGVHAEERAVAAAIRSCFAKVYAKIGWRSPCDLRLLDEPRRAAVRALAEWILELTTDAILSKPCAHHTPVRHDLDRITLEVVSDASATGAGYVISLVGRNGARHVLVNGAWRFTAAQRVYHSNRRELAVCCRAVQAAADLLSHFASKSSHIPPVRLVVRSDNRPTVAWLQGEGGVSRSSLERRAVLRTLNALKDELDFLRSLCRSGPEKGIVIEHISGVANSEADGLSRIFEKMVPLPSGKKISLADALLGGVDILPDAAEYPDIFQEPDGVGQGLSWVMREADERVLHEVDVFQLLCVLAPGPSPRHEAAGLELLATPEGQGKPEPIVTTLCHRNWDVEGVQADFEFLRRVFRAMRPKHRLRRVFRALRPERIIIEESRTSLLRALQQDFDPIQLKATGPYVLDEHGIYCFRNGSPDGGHVLLPLLPANDTRCAPYRRKLLLDSHRRSAHGGLGSTMSRISYSFYIPGLRCECKKLIKYCYCCQLQRARRTWQQLPGLGDSKKEQLNWEPYHDVYIDFLHLGEVRGYDGPTTILTVYCLATGHSCWVPCAETQEAVLRGLRRVQAQEGGLAIIRCDQASYFRSSKFEEEVSRQLGGQVMLMKARSPWLSGGGERLHALGLRIARVLLRGQTGTSAGPGRRRRRKADGSVDLEEICREVTLLLNTRPLDFANAEDTSGELFVVTPDLLARGFTRKTGCLALASSSAPIASRIRAVRTFFLARVFGNMRQAVAKSFGYKTARGRPLNLSIGDPVLVYRPGKKVSPGFRMGRVTSVTTSQRSVTVRLNDGSEALQHHYNVVKLLKDPALSQQGGRDEI